MTFAPYKYAGQYAWTEKKTHTIDAFIDWDNFYGHTIFQQQPQQQQNNTQNWSTPRNWDEKKDNMIAKHLLITKQWRVVDVVDWILWAFFCSLWLFIRVEN